MSEKDARIEAYRARIRDLLGPEFPEAGGCAEARVVHKGVEYTVTQRAANPYDALAALVYSVTFMQSELGISTSTSTPVALGAQKVAGSQVALPAGGNGQDVDTDTMPVELIKLGQGGEHPYWIIQGGKWKKHGVICWPEVLESIGVLDSLDPFKENRLDGPWVARFKKNEKGNPDKVLELFPANA